MSRYSSTMCVAKGLDINLLDSLRPTFRALAQAKGMIYKVRFRGPRKHRTGRAYAKQSYCLKSDATHFAVYLYNR